MYSQNDYVTVKITKKAHETLRNLRHEFYVDTYPEVIDKLLDEHHRKGEVLQ